MFEKWENMGFTMRQSQKETHLYQLKADEKEEEEEEEEITLER